MQTAAPPLWRDTLPLCVQQLGVEKKKVTVRKFKNMKLIDIREYYQKDGKWLPGSKGLSLTEDQWNVLVSKMVDIGEALVKIDDKEQFNVMKAALDRKQQQQKEDEEAEEYEADSKDDASAAAVAAAAADEDEDDEDEDIGDVEFEDVSEAPAQKRGKTE